MPVVFYNGIYKAYVFVGGDNMRTAALFKNGKNQAVRLPKEFEFKGVTEVEISKEGESIILTPKRKSWISFVDIEPVDDEFLVDRPDIIEEGKVEF